MKRYQWFVLQKGFLPLCTVRMVKLVDLNILKVHSVLCPPWQLDEVEM
jgi:hypothetical protein